MWTHPIYVQTPAARHNIRGRLFRRYLTLILFPVTIALLASNAISIYFSYHEIKSGLASVQHEKALATASWLGQYIRQIGHLLTYAALPRLDAEARQTEFRKLLQWVPAVTHIAQLDSADNVQVAVSRPGLVRLGPGEARSDGLAFSKAQCGQPWFGPAHIEAEPYLTIAIRACGDKATEAATVATVSLKIIWDDLSDINIAKNGKVYMIDSNGFLIADPDMGLTLRKTDMSELPHVKGAIAGEHSDELAKVSVDLTGTPVLISVAPVEAMRWYVFVEQPMSRVYEKLNPSIQRTGLQLLAGLVISALVALALVHRTRAGELGQ